MFCVKCQADVADCACPDIEERLASLAASGKLIYRMCGLCGCHWSRCQCPEPLWGLSCEVIDPPKVESV